VSSTQGRIAIIGRRRGIWPTPENHYRISRERPVRPVSKVRKKGQYRTQVDAVSDGALTRPMALTNASPLAGRRNSNGRKFRSPYYMLVIAQNVALLRALASPHVSPFLKCGEHHGHGHVFAAAAILKRSRPSSGPPTTKSARSEMPSSRWSDRLKPLHCLVAERGGSCEDVSHALRGAIGPAHVRRLAPARTACGPGRHSHPIASKGNRPPHTDLVSSFISR